MTDSQEKELKNIFNKIIKDTVVENPAKDFEIVTTTLEPLKISMVAPRAAGKTSLLTSIFRFLDERISSRNFRVEISNDSKEIIKDYIDALAVIKNADNGDDVSAKINNLAATPGIRKFEFVVVFEKEKQGKIVRVKQPFVIMDVPGGVVTDHIDDGKLSQFEEHLHSSSILLIPFDSLLLMQDVTTSDKEMLDKYKSSHMGTEYLEKYGVKWAKFRDNDKHPKVIFVAMKSESYHSRALDNTLADKCYEKFKDKYNSVCTKIASYSPKGLTMDYTPLETIGCIKCVDASYDDKTDRINYTFNKVSAANDLTGCGPILKAIFDRTIEQLDDIYGAASEYVKEIKKQNFIQKTLNVLNTLSVYRHDEKITDVFDHLELLKSEFGSVTESDKCFKEKYNHNLIL